MSKTKWKSLPAFISPKPKEPIFQYHDLLPYYSDVEAETNIVVVEYLQTMIDMLFELSCIVGKFVGSIDANLRSIQIDTNQKHECLQLHVLVDKSHFCYKYESYEFKNHDYIDYYSNHSNNFNHFCFGYKKCYRLNLNLDSATKESKFFKFVSHNYDCPCFDVCAKKTYLQK